MLIKRASCVLYAEVIATTALSVTIWYAVSRGQDFNWDQENYHLGIPVLLARSSFWDSIAPAGIQSYLNPYVLQIQLLGIGCLNPIAFAVGLAVVQSLAFMIAGSICGGIARPVGGWQAMTFALIGFGLSLLAPMSLSEAGTTLIDLVTAVPVVAAYACC